MIPSLRSRPFWLSNEGRGGSPTWWLFAAAVLVSMLLVEVWQTSHMTELCLSLEKSRAAVERGNARLDFVRADFERRTTRAELAPLASELGLAPADVQQVVNLPSEYLAAGEITTPGGSPASPLAWAERASRALVPEATARDRNSD